MIIALVLSCGLTSLPVLAAMIVVKHAGVSLSGPRYTPLDDHMLYVRWDEGHLGALVSMARRWAQLQPAPVPIWATDDEPRGLIAVYDIGTEDIPPYPYGK